MSQRTSGNVVKFLQGSGPGERKQFYSWKSTRHARECVIIPSHTCDVCDWAEKTFLKIWDFKSSWATALLLQQHPCLNRVAEMETFEWVWWEVEGNSWVEWNMQTHEHFWSPCICNETENDSFPIYWATFLSRSSATNDSLKSRKIECVQGV